MNHAKMTQLHRSPNGDTWFFAGDPATGLAFVRHQANTPSGGQVSDIEIGAFLNGPQHPEHEALLRLIGTLILEAPGIDRGDELSIANTGREWSDEELFRLDDMLIRGISIEEIAHLLRRRPGEVQDKVVEIGRSCRMSGSAAGMSEPAKVFEDRKFAGDWRVEKFDDDGGAEVAIFCGPNARERAVQYAEWRYRCSRRSA
jgi:hypothetical protein